MNHFKQNHQEKDLPRKTNLSISMMCLSNNAKKFHSRQYRELCSRTREGIYLNALYNDEGGAGAVASGGGDKMDRLAQRFFSTMDVYPTDVKTNTIREFFGAF